MSISLATTSPSAMTSTWLEPVTDIKFGFTFQITTNMAFTLLQKVANFITTHMFWTERNHDGQELIQHFVYYVHCYVATAVAHNKKKCRGIKIENISYIPVSCIFDAYRGHVTACIPVCLTWCVWRGTSLSVPWDRKTWNVGAVQESY